MIPDTMTVRLQTSRRRRATARRALPLVAAILLCFEPHDLQAQETASVPPSIEAFREAFVSAVQAWDVDRWSQLFAENGVMMAPSGRMLEGREAFHRLWTNTFEGRTGRNPLSVQIDDVRIQDDLAVVRATYGPEGGDSVGQYVWVLRRSSSSTGSPWILDWWIFNRAQ